MKKRSILIAVIGFTMVVMMLKCGGGKAELNELDRYGGWTKIKLTKTGFFHTEHDGNRWWFVTPDGHAFLSFGVNHYHDSWWNQEYNRDYWNGVFGGEYGDEQWNAGFRKAAAQDMNRLQINTLAWHTTAPAITDLPDKAILPYLRIYNPIRLDHYICPSDEHFEDVFSQEFKGLCDAEAQRVAIPYADDPLLIGYAMSDCPPFTEYDVNSLCATTTWSRKLPNLRADAPGKQAYVEFMKKRYAEISKFNQTYNSKFKSWDDLLNAENWRSIEAAANEQEAADRDAFMLLCVDRYYAESKAAIEKYDSNHLFLGDKLNGNTDTMDKVLEVAAQYVDVMVYQFYGTLAQQEALLDGLVDRVDVPFMNGDIGFSSPSEMMPNPHGPHAKTQAERAGWLIESCLGCFARPEFIGWHMCGMIDTWKTMPTKETAQHQGLMTVTGEFYPEMEAAVQKIAGEMYQTAKDEK